MKKVLCISPHFPPVNAADMHRLRQSLPYFKKFGWEPVIFTVEPDSVEMAKDDLLLETIPDDVEIHWVKAFATRWTRKFGLGNLGIRSYWQYRRVVDDYLKDRKVDLIYFSTTVFTLMALGPHWKKKFGIPFVVDLQDPWRNDYYLRLPKSERPKKFWFDYKQKKFLEALTMPMADGIISVSAGYIETMKQRYPKLKDMLCLTLPFGALQKDFDIASSIPPGENDSSALNIVYVGRGGKDMAFSVSALFCALAEGLKKDKETYSKLRFYFIGTSYAVSGRGKKTIMPLAKKYDVYHQVTEITDRLPYYESLRALLDADMLFIPGSVDSDYTASKIYPYILAKQPLLAVFNRNSSVVDVIRSTLAGEVVTFENNEGVESVSKRIGIAINRMLKKIPFVPNTDWGLFEVYTAKSMTEKQCAYFEDVVDRE